MGISPEFKALNSHCGRAQPMKCAECKSRNSWIDLKSSPFINVKYWKEE